MRILVTGGTGRVGQTAVSHLLSCGHEVKIIGLDEDFELAGSTYARCDIDDYENLCAHVRDADGIVHLAAIPYPGGGTPEEIFHVNCTGTFNVYQAAAAAGIKRVVSASSINALGFNFGTVHFDIEYFPIDEDHRALTPDAYSFSKQILEETADYFWRRERISGVQLRFPFVYIHDDTGHFGEMRAHVMQTYSELMQMAPTEQKKAVEEFWQHFSKMRQERSFEKPWEERKKEREQSAEEPQRRMYFGVSDFWSTIDARNAAIAIEKGLSSDYEGSHPLFVCDANNSTGIASEVLAQRFYSQVQMRKKSMEDTQSLLSFARAQELIGYAPQY
jgi:nucleoside-diphosphate-sugar epimerase